LATIESLTKRLESYLPAEQIALVRKAYRFALDAHEGQFRKDGDPYITHPLAVAGILTDMHMDAQSLVAALLHDVLEDCGITKERLAEEFGPDVADLVDGVSKITLIEFPTRAEQQAENLRKMILAMTKDIRVILVKLADRLHNMRTLGDLSAEKRKRIAAETLEIYAPIANRLGLHTVYQELDDLRHQLEAARHEASTDALTGLANRKAFDTALHEQSARARDTRNELCLVMADIDHFKHFNDSHGHLIGDKLLRFVANILKDSVKGQDLVARFGGEEFAILLPDTPLRGALAVAESLRARVQNQRLRRTDNQRPLGGVTLSLGIACFRDGEAADTFVARADAALYQSKRLGRNRVTPETQLPAA